jgi:uncharacterized protein YidB (DUF937 family)
MSLLNAVIGALGQGQGGAANPQAQLINAVIGMLAGGGAQGGGAAAAGGMGGLGGLAGLVAKMTQGGQGDVVNSWISTGENKPISPDALGQVLGGDTIGNMASQLGMNQGDLLGQLSQMLPQVVDKLTPQGQIPQGDLGALLGGGGGGGGPDLGALLGGLLGKR